MVNQPNQGGVDDDETDLLSSLEEMYLILELKTQQQQLFLVAAQQQQLFLDAAHQQKLFYDEQIDVLNILSLLSYSTENIPLFWIRNDEVALGEKFSSSHSGEEDNFESKHRVFQATA